MLKQLPALIKLIIMFTLLFVLLFGISCCEAGELTTSLGSTSDIAPGCSNPVQITKLDVGYSWNKELSQSFSYDKEAYTTLIHSKDYYHGIGGRLRLNWNITDDLKLFGGGGIA